MDDAAQCTECKALRHEIRYSLAKMRRFSDECALVSQLVSQMSSESSRDAFKTLQKDYISESEHHTALCGRLDTHRKQHTD